MGPIFRRHRQPARPCRTSFVASETIPLDPGGPSARNVAELANLPQPSVPAEEILRLLPKPRQQPGGVVGGGDHDLARSFSDPQATNNFVNVPPWCCRGALHKSARGISGRVTRACLTLETTDARAPTARGLPTDRSRYRCPARGSAGAAIAPDADASRAAWRDAFQAVRGETERRAAPLSRRGSGHPVDAGRQPDQMAPRAHHLVLRAVPAAAARCPATASSTSASPTCSIPITSPPARAMRGRSAA